MVAHTTHTDTSVEARAALVSRFRAMSVAERATTFTELNDMCTELALAGIRRSHGELSPDAVRWHLTFRRYGRSLADEAFGPCPDE